MTRYRLHAQQFVPRPIDEVFTFFEQPDNLGRLTPGAMGFEPGAGDKEMREGLELQYRIRPVLGIPMTWRSRIQAYDPPHGFEDVQVAGPYRSWHHRHAFSEVDGGTLVEDEVTYELPLGGLGGIAHSLVVRSELEWIFKFRAQAIATILEPAGVTDDPMTIAVAGATGFVGGAISVELRRRGHNVIGLTHRAGGARGWLPDEVELRSADVTNGEGLYQALAGADALVIALAFPNSPIEAPRKHLTFDEVDAAGTERLAAVALDAGVTRLLYVSGAGAAANAERHWFRAKWRAETAIRESGIPYTIIRPTWIYGPRDVSLNRFLGFARQLLSVPLTNTGRQLLAPVFVDDVAALAADSLVGDEATNEVFEIGGPETLQLREIVDRAMRASGLHRPIIPGPTPLIKLGAALVSWLPKPPLTPDAVDFINQPATVDLAPLLMKMPRDLTWLDDGLATYLGRNAGAGQVSVGRVDHTDGIQTLSPSRKGQTTG